MVDHLAPWGSDGPVQVEGSLEDWVEIMRTINGEEERSKPSKIDLHYY